MTIRPYINERHRMEGLIADELADLRVRANAAAILLQHALADGLRQDITRMFLLWTEELGAAS